jgi:penicillin-binding protein 1A
MNLRRKSSFFSKKKLFFLMGGLFGFAILLAAAFYALVALVPGEEIRLGNIQKILAVESPVYYRDGVQKIGVFFQEQHRQYVPFEEIPKNFVNAIVAAEDHEFFHHFGVDFKGVIRAVIANVMAGRVVQGGSTISQQTAKNLFKRRDRSLWAKLKELLFAFRLEYRYSKEQILEFYANQFYVSGNGRGLGVAARYYFDKQVSDLNLVECAFIAGSVKRPSAYNPFIQQNEEKTQKAQELAQKRTHYVLKQMLQLGMFNSTTYAEAIQQPVPFNKGKMSYRLNAVMDQVKIALGEPLVEEALSRHGIDNVATSGVRIFTTLDKELQESSFFALKKELSRLDIRLSGYNRKEVQERYDRLTSVDEKPRIGGFAMGWVQGVEHEDGNVSVKVTFGRQDEEGITGTIDYRGLLNALEPLVRFFRNRWSEADRKDLPLLLEQLKEGDMVFVSVREQDNLTGNFILDLEKYPDLQGGVLLLQDGIIRAMVGGFENSNYNRAIYARRPLGSAFKPLVYLAAQQLGWSSIDLLRNARDVFVYFDQPYFPRPDHISPHEYVSMSWAGVLSENVATVWLLYHLCDQLNTAQFKEVVDFLQLGRQPGESYASYSRRIRDEHGIVANGRRLYEAAFNEVVKNMEADLVFEGQIREYEILKNLYYSLDGQSVEDDPKEPEETALRRNLLKKSFTHLQRIKNQILEGQYYLTDEDTQEQLPLYLAQATEESAVAGQLGVFSEIPDQKRWQVVDWSTLTERFLFWPFESQLAAKRDAILVEGLLPVSLINILEPLIEAEYKRLDALPPYDPQVLFQLRDFRVYAGLQYLIGLCRSLGIESELEPVLSFPLGSNVITLFEAAKAYEGIMRGEVVLNQALEAGAELFLIDRIESSDGEVIFEPQHLIRGVTDPAISLSVSDILRDTVRYGTGHMAHQELRLVSNDPEKQQNLKILDLRVPAFGKTGTANDFTNSAFVGFIPAPLDKGNMLSLEHGYVISSYIGYDDNRPMVRGSTHITGAGGALPVWVRVAKGIIKDMDFAASMDAVDLSFTGLSELQVRLPDLGQIRVPVDPEDGGIPLPIAAEGSSGGIGAAGRPSVITFGSRNSRNEVEPRRIFAPYWQSRME